MVHFLSHAACLLEDLHFNSFLHSPMQVNLVVLVDFSLDEDPLLLYQVGLFSLSLKGLLHFLTNALFVSFDLLT